MSTQRMKLPTWRHNTVESAIFRDESVGNIEQVRDAGAGADGNDGGVESDDIYDDLVDDGEDIGFDVQEETCRDLSIHFGDIVGDREEESDGDSGDDIWDDEKIPDPLSSYEDEEEVERRELLANTVDSDELLFLGKTFGCAADFKTALLRYSLKSRYDIKLCKSTASKLAAKCSDEATKCPCGCNKWQLTGIPCIHVASVIIATKLRTEDYVSSYYTTSKLQQTYARGIKPVQGMKLWPRLNRLAVLPPPFRLGNRGRPSNHDRRKSANESSSSSNKTRLSREKRVITCSKCREEGHTKITCPNPTVENAPKRPRKDVLEERPSQDASQGPSQSASQAT